MEAKFTKTTWRRKTTMEGIQIYSGAKTIAKVNYDNFGLMTDETSRANSKLIMNAPELYNILRQLVDLIGAAELNDDDTENIVPVMQEAEELLQSSIDI